MRPLILLTTSFEPSKPLSPFLAPVAAWEARSSVTVSSPITTTMATDMVSRAEAALERLLQHAPVAERPHARRVASTHERDLERDGGAEAEAEAADEAGEDAGGGGEATAEDAHKSHGPM
eukprot:CAMPEP_0206248324 /NCGR_PEP_ID=MMETSP0047_2-20121206/20310_1 /ASSEMBLY_ACC=CAM_ASM_000192 /TAXON_ID=195065 /ORGANISM="Chroomonas mesostigmatica_cf, Strain CCMP1168" /LENGTH=119 /DNA_ID=CAMNT_0053673963 /DNA_START=146 /DNA_END=501 /DNA_ORIENTATION=+